MRVRVRVRAAVGRGWLREPTPEAPGRGSVPRWAAVGAGGRRRLPAHGGGALRLRVRGQGVQPGLGCWAGKELRVLLRGSKLRGEVGAAAAGGWGRHWVIKDC